MTTIEEDDDTCQCLCHTQAFIESGWTPIDMNAVNERCKLLKVPEIMIGMRILMSTILSGGGMTIKLHLNNIINELEERWGAQGLNLVRPILEALLINGFFAWHVDMSTMKFSIFPPNFGTFFMRYDILGHCHMRYKPHFSWPEAISHTTIYNPNSCVCEVTNSCQHCRSMNRTSSVLYGDVSTGCHVGITIIKPPDRNGMIFTEFACIMDIIQEVDFYKQKHAVATSGMARPPLINERTLLSKEDPESYSAFGIDATTFSAFADDPLERERHFSASTSSVFDAIAFENLLSQKTNDKTMINGNQHPFYPTQVPRTAHTSVYNRIKRALMGVFYNNVHHVINGT